MQEGDSGDDRVQHGTSQVAPHTYPRNVHLIDELPKSATGMIIKRELRES